MAATSQAEKNTISAKWAEILETGAAPVRVAAAPALAAEFDPRGEFCKDWPDVKKFLQAVQSLLPQPAPILIGLIVAAGDAAFGTVCPVH